MVAGQRDAHKVAEAHKGMRQKLVFDTCMKRRMTAL